MTKERTVLHVVGLSKTFGSNVALDEVNLTVEHGQVHALLGENGSGKSTFIKILSGYHAADPGGEIRVRGQRLTDGSPGASAALGCRFVHQDLGLVGALSVADNLCLTTGFPTRRGTISRTAMRRRVSQDLAAVGLDLDPRQLVSSLSPAVRTGIAVARALSDPAGQAPAALLVLDEPTATLSENEVRQLLQIVRNVAVSGTGVLYVTHHLDEVFEIADVVTVLRDGRKVATTPVEELTRGALVTQLVGSELDEVRVSSRALPDAHGDALLQVRDLAAGPLASLSLDIRAGDLVGIAGLTGSGRDTALAAIFGAIPRERGTVVVGEQQLRTGDVSTAIGAGMAYLPADRTVHAAVMQLSAAENLTLANLRPFWRLPRLRRRLERDEVQMWFDRLDVRPREGANQPLSSFSGGNQQKVLLAKWLRCAPKVLLLDEPTQGVDIGAKGEIHRQLLLAAQQGAAVVVSSSDLDELAALCHRVIVLRAGRVGVDLSDADVSVQAMAHAALTQEREAS